MEQIGPSRAQIQINLGDDSFVIMQVDKNIYLQTLLKMNFLVESFKPVDLDVTTAAISVSIKSDVLNCRAVNSECHGTTSVRGKYFK